MTQFCNMRRLLRLLPAVPLVICLALPVQAHDGVHVNDPYLRSSGETASTAAAFMELENHKTDDETLLSATSDAAERVELHTHAEDANGVMTMREMPGGFAVPGNGTRLLERGGDHLMFIGLKQPLKDGDVVKVILTFAPTGEVVVDIPVDNARKPRAAAHAGHHTSP